MNKIQELQRHIYNEYANDLQLDTNAKYLHGTPLKPVVPLDTGTRGLFILGAYPSARFAHVNKVSDVPVADNLGPFESERWFDGSRVRLQPSAKELEELFLEPLSVTRDCCWITDLVKVFLFKKGHIQRYDKLNAIVPIGYERERFFELGEQSLLWLQKELEIAEPSFVITLGAEVAGIIHGVRSSTSQSKLLVPEVVDMDVGGISIPTLHCAHPGILMRRDPNNPWPERHKKEFIPALKSAKLKYGF